MCESPDKKIKQTLSGGEHRRSLTSEKSTRPHLSAVNANQSCSMAKGKKGSSPKGRKITLKVAKNSVKLTMDGKRSLDLSNMQINTFPKCILKLADVDELDLSRNTLKKIPDSIECFLKLRRLDLHSNRLEQLPASLGKLQDLCHLNLCNNRLSAGGLPAEMGRLQNLRTLNLGMNRIESLPSFLATLKGLQELGVFDNMLTALPDCVSGLPNLTKLNAKGNPFARPDDGSASDPIQKVECLYLVNQDMLCTLCLNKCKEERQKLTMGKYAVASHRKPLFPGLTTPNSVAQENQTLWR